jgi:hypothetical protein
MSEVAIVVVGFLLMLLGCLGLYFVAVIVIAFGPGNVSTFDLLAEMAVLWGGFGPPILLGFHLTFTRWWQDATTDKIFAVLIGLTGIAWATVALFHWSDASAYMTAVVVSAGLSVLPVVFLPCRTERS